MDSWENYFNAKLALPTKIKEDALIYDTMVVVSKITGALTVSELVETLLSNKREPLRIDESKFFHVTDIDIEHEGCSIALYQKVKREDAPSESTTLFVVRVNQYTWLGQFDNQHKGEVLSKLRVAVDTLCHEL